VKWFALANLLSGRISGLAVNGTQIAALWENWRHQIRCQGELAPFERRQIGEGNEAQAAEKRLPARQQDPPHVHIS
jgi:hypothetical protein